MRLSRTNAEIDRMPELSRFHGIVIRMFWEPDAPHHRPHFHAFYQEEAASIAIDTMEVLAGGLPRRQLQLVEAWAAVHQAELLQAWQSMIALQPIGKIDPL
jgi:hypothetical protein